MVCCCKTRCFHFSRNNDVPAHCDLAMRSTFEFNQARSFGRQLKRLQPGAQCIRKSMEQKREELSMLKKGRRKMCDQNINPEWYLATDHSPALRTALHKNGCSSWPQDHMKSQPIPAEVPVSSFLVLVSRAGLSPATSIPGMCTSDWTWAKHDKHRFHEDNSQNSTHNHETLLLLQARQDKSHINLEARCTRGHQQRKSESRPDKKKSTW